MPTLASVKETTAPSPAFTAWRCRRFCSIRAALAFSFSLISSNISIVVVGETVGDLVWRGPEVGNEEGAILPSAAVAGSVAAEVGTAVCGAWDGISEGEAEGASVGLLLGEGEGDAEGLVEGEAEGLLEGDDDGLVEG